MHWREASETLTITLAAAFASMILFGLFMLAFARVNPIELFQLMYLGGFGTAFSWQNTLTRAAPLILAALCTALPARAGLIVVGGEGALVLGGLAAVGMGLAYPTAPPFFAHTAMATAAMITGGLLMLLVGALRYFRGVNETICSLLLTYISIGVFSYLVEGPMRDPSSLNKPSTFPIPEGHMIEGLFGMDVHWGLAFGIAACLISYVLMEFTTFGFSASVIGGNVRAAQVSGLPIAKVVLITTFLGGCLRRTGRHGGNRGSASSGQCLVDCGLRIHRDPGLVCCAASPDQHHSGGDTIWRLERVVRFVAAAP